MSCEVVVVQSFVSSQILFATGDFFKDKCDSFFCEFFGQLENLSTVVFIGDFLPYIVRIPPFHSVGCFQSLF